jgi:hypothetical protein
VLSPIPGTLFVTGNFQPGFMNQGRSLERMLIAFAREPMRRQSAQLLIDQGEQFLRCLRVAPLDALENVSDLTHEPNAWEVARRTISQRLLKAASWAEQAERQKEETAVIAIR